MSSPAAEAASSSAERLVASELSTVIDPPPGQATVVRLPLAGPMPPGWAAAAAWAAACASAACRAAASACSCWRATTTSRCASSRRIASSRAAIAPCSASSWAASAGSILASASASDSLRSSRSCTSSTKAACCDCADSRSVRAAADEAALASAVAAASSCSPFRAFSSDWAACSSSRTAASASVCKSTIDAFTEASATESPVSASMASSLGGLMKASTTTSSLRATSSSIRACVAATAASARSTPALALASPAPARPRPAACARCRRYRSVTLARRLLILPRRPASPRTSRPPSARLPAMPELRTETVDRVAVVTLDAPARRNALTLDLVDEIVATLDAIEGDPDIGAIVVTGASPAFCAGADLSHLGASKRQGLRRIYEGFLRIGRSPLPTIAAVNGAAVGAGVNLALVCDVIVAGESARFDTRFLQLGLHPGGGHTWMLRRRVGPQAAAAMILFGRVLDGPAAAEEGLAWACVPDDDLLPLALEMASAAASAPRDLVERVKQTMRDITQLADHAAAVERELDPQVWSINQPAFQEKLAALRERIASK